MQRDLITVTMVVGMFTLIGILGILVLAQDSTSGPYSIRISTQGVVHPPEPNRLLVVFSAETPDDQQRHILQEEGATISERAGSNAYVVSSQSISREELASRFYDRRQVRSVGYLY